MKKAIKKKRRWRRVFYTVGSIFIACIVTAYFLLSSPRFIFWAIQQVNHIIPGQIVYEQLRLDFDNRELDVKNLKYLNESDEVALWVDKLHLNFKLGSVLKGNLQIPQLRAGNIVFDTQRLPKREKESTLKSQWRTILKILLKRISIEDGQVASLNLRVSDQTELQLHNIKLSLSNPKIATQEIKVSADDSELRWKNHSIQSERLAYEGQVDLPAVREYAFFVAAATGQLKMEKVSYLDQELGSFHSELNIDGDRVSFKKALFEGPLATLPFEFSYLHEKENPEWTIDLKTQKEIVLDPIPRLSKNLKATFRALQLELHAKMRGKTLATASGNLLLKIQALSKAYPYDQAEDYSLETEGPVEKGVLDLKKFLVTAPHTALTASGKVDFAHQTFDNQVEAKVFSVTDLINSITEVDIRGSVLLKGSVKGPFRQPDFDIQAEAKESAYSILNFGSIIGRFRIVNGDLTFEGGTPASESRKAKVDVRVSQVFKPTRETAIHADFQQLVISDLLAKPDFSGKVSGTFEMTGKPNSQNQGLLKGQVDDFVAYGFHLGPANLEAKLENRTFTLTHLDIQPPGLAVLTTPKPVVFQFDDKGWGFEGEALPGAQVKGVFLKSNPTKVHVEASAKNLDLRPIWAALLIPAIESYGDGKIEMDLGIRTAPTLIRIEASRFVVPLEDFEIQNRGPVILVIRPPKLEFQKAEFEALGEKFSIKGDHTFGGDMNLKFEGRANLGVLKFFPEYFRDGAGFANLDLAVRGKFEDPKIAGDIQFVDSGLTFRPVRLEVERLNGKLHFAGDSVVFEKLSGSVREGDLVVTGKIDLKNYDPQFYDLLIEAREVAISEPEIYKVIFSGDFSLKGPSDKVTLAGSMDVTEGTYSRDFSISDFIIKPQVTSLPEEPSAFMQKLWLNLKIRSPGELAIKNNIARMYFRSDLQVTGPATQPMISGALEVLDGVFNYFKINFEKARGVIDFRNFKRGAYVDITATKEFEGSFDSPIVTVHIFGFLDNLRLDFESNPPLGKRDIISLLFTGSLPGNARRLSGVNIATTLLASQLSQVIQRSLARNGQLDIFRVEASAQQSGSLTSLVVGKKLTDRFSLEFKTDLGANESVQAVQMEYLLLDNVLLKGSQSTTGRFNLDLTLRFEIY